MTAQHGPSGGEVDYRQAARRLAERYQVKDIVPDRAAFLFLLESPHKDELKHGAPVSGSSGRSMSRHLFGEAYGHLPLGIIVKENRDETWSDGQVGRIGLMNVCTIPMQQSAYAGGIVSEGERSLVRVLERLRTAGPKAFNRDAVLQWVQDMILEDLRRRLMALSDRPLMIVPCGRFAQKFFAASGVQSPRWQVLADIPHPSYNHWNKAVYREAVQRLLSAFHAT